MADLISRAAAIDALTNTNLKRNVDSVYDGDMNRTRRAAQRVIAQLPAVDAVPAIRCRECKHRWDSIRCSMYSEGMDTPDNWFCADGERRGSE